MQSMHWTVHAIFLADLCIRVSLSVRVIMRRLPVGVSLAWLAIILIFPFAGALVYLLLGEYRLGRSRVHRAATYRTSQFRSPATPLKATALDPASMGHGAIALARLAHAALDAAVLPNNRLELLHDADAAFPALLADIERARRTCDLEFYICSPGGRVDEVAEALRRAAKRGVNCRVLVDAIGSKAFLRSTLTSELRASGVRVVAALPAGPLSWLLTRPDLRLHRKIAVFDDELAYTGSLNLADPRFFKQDAGVGQWVDALVRVQGPTVAALANTFREDWSIESGDTLPPLSLDDGNLTTAKQGTAVVQVLPTGPDARVEAIEQIVLMALYAASRDVVLTTPYFVPSESLLYALYSAAGRGVQVTLIVPAKIDSKLVRFASRAYQADLLAAGVRVALFQDGLLHTKSITVDDQFSLFGSLNLDPRSLRLDFEITLAVYDGGFTTDLRRLQQRYLDRSNLLDLDVCRARSGLECLAENSARLAGPLL